MRSQITRVTFGPMISAWPGEGSEGEIFLDGVATGSIMAPTSMFNGYTVTIYIPAANEIEDRYFPVGPGGEGRALATARAWARKLLTARS